MHVYAPAYLTPVCNLPSTEFKRLKQDGKSNQTPYTKKSYASPRNLLTDLHF